MNPQPFRRPANLKPDVDFGQGAGEVSVNTGFYDAPRSATVFARRRGA